MPLAVKTGDVAIPSLPVVTLVSLEAEFANVPLAPEAGAVNFTVLFPTGL